MRLVLAAAATAALATLAGCSEPVPQTPDGAFFVQMIQDDPSQCMIAGNTAQEGVIDNAMRGTVVSDGTNMTVVDCTVQSNAGNMAAPFQVHGKLDATGKTGDYLEIEIASISPSATEMAPAVGSVIFASPKTAEESYNGNTCTFFFENKETVDDGKIWVSFACTNVVSGMSTCAISKGYAIFENCLTAAVGM
jgi:hypothetical protein